MARNESLTFVIRAKNMFANTFAAAKKGLSSLASSAASAAKRFGVAFAAMAASSLVLGRSLVNTWKQQATGEARLEAVLKATGYAAGFTAAELKKKANVMQRLTSVDADAIIPAQALLATFREIKGDQFKEATVAILDMATVMASTTDGTINLQSATMAVGKALNDPIRGITALRRVGVSFTKQQEEQIRNFVATGQAAKAQAIILAELKREFGGAAEGGNKMVKAIDLAKATFGDLQESIGGAIANSATFREAITKIQQTMDRLAESGEMEAWAEGIMRLLGRVAESARGIVAVFHSVSETARTIGNVAGFMAGGFTFDEARNAERSMRSLMKAEAEIQSERQARQRQAARKTQDELDRIEMEGIQRRAKLFAARTTASNVDTRRDELAEEERAIVSRFAEVGDIGEGEVRRRLQELIDKHKELQAEAERSIGREQAALLDAEAAASELEQAYARVEQAQKQAMAADPNRERIRELAQSVKDAKIIEQAARRSFNAARVSTAVDMERDIFANPNPRNQQLAKAELQTAIAAREQAEAAFSAAASEYNARKDGHKTALAILATEQENAAVAEARAKAVQDTLTNEQSARKELGAELKKREAIRESAEGLLDTLEGMQKEREIKIKFDADTSIINARIASIEKQIRNVLVLDTANPREERQQLQDRQADAKRIAKETADDADRYARLAERRSQGRPLTRRSREWAEAYEEAGSSLKVATDLQAQKASLELRRGEVQEKMAETLEKIREDLSKLLRAS